MSTLVIDNTNKVRVRSHNSSNLMTYYVTQQFFMINEPWIVESSSKEKCVGDLFLMPFPYFISLSGKRGMRKKLQIILLLSYTFQLQLREKDSV